MSEPNYKLPRCEDRADPQAQVQRLFRPFADIIREERLRFLMFIVVAGLSVPVNLVSRVLFSLVTWFEVAVVLSHLCGMVVAFTLAKLFVFEPSGKSIRSEFARFTLVNIASLAQTWIIAVGLVKFVWPMLGMAFHPELTGHFIGLASSAITS